MTTPEARSPSPSLRDRRILVVGASAGIGRSFALHAISMGAEVCVAARRADKLAELCAAAGGGTALAADVTDAEQCARMVAEAVAALGGLDLVLYTAGSGVLAPVGTSSAEVWRHTFDVNVVGAMLVCQAAVPALAPDGVMSFMSSESTDAPRWGLGVYSATKTALDRAIGAWRLEYPGQRFQRVVMGATFPTEFGAGFDAGLLDTAFGHWSATGVPSALMDTDDVALELAEMLAVCLAHPAIELPDLTLQPRAQASQE